MSGDVVAKLRLARTDGVGPVTYRRLMAQFGSAEASIIALPDLARAGGRMSPLKIATPRAAEQELEKLRRLGGTMVFVGDPAYPPLLAMLTDPPPLLSVLGDVSVLAARAVGLVGARNASANGRRVADHLAKELAASGLVVVSGLARGIDTAAHEGALRAGRTVAAVAGGLDEPYPPENAALQARIAEHGAVVTEAPLGTALQSRHFPRRNRVIAGLSLGVVVVEAALRSGSLITARLALEADREVFAVPGSPLDQRSRGSNDLLRQGAHLVEGADDVLANLPDHPSRQGLSRSPIFARPREEGLAEPRPDFPPPPAEAVAAAQAEILILLSAAPTDVDELIRLGGSEASSVMVALMQLELSGRVEFLPGNRVCLLT